MAYLGGEVFNMGSTHRKARKAYGWGIQHTEKHAYGVGEYSKLSENGKEYGVHP